MGYENFEQPEIPSPEESPFEVGKSVRVQGKAGEFVILGRLKEEGKFLVLENGEGNPIEVNESDLSPDEGVARIDLLNDASFSKLDELDQKIIKERTAERKRQVGGQDQIAA